MIKALLKKQLLESTAFLFYGRNGKRRSVRSLGGVGVLMLYCVVVLGEMFYFMGETLSAPLAAQGLDWVYFAFMGAMATAVGVVGSIFAAKTKLYEAKDNDLLLSMPVPPWLILCTRMAGLYCIAWLFEAFVFVPALAAYFVGVGFSFPALFGGLVVLLVMPLGTLAICCVLGWLIALLTAKLRAKNLVTVVLSVGALAGYFFVYSKINEYLTYVITNGGVVAEKLQGWLYPFAQLGRGVAGEMLPLLLFTGIFAGAFALVYFIISKTYIRLATANKGGKKVKYTSKEGKQTPVFFALVKKELRRFIHNPMVALNCFLGTLFLSVAPFVLLFTKEFTSMLVALNEDELVALVLAALLCAVAAVNIVAAASVSLEGESFWIVRSMPVSTERILLAKGGFHFFVTGLPALFACVFLCILLKIGAWLSICVALVVLTFVLFASAFGLTINLKMPNIHWTNELAVVKQSMSAILSTFAEWGGIGALVGGYFLFGKYLPASVYALICAGALFVASGLAVMWLQKKGTKVFESL